MKEKKLRGKKCRKMKSLTWDLWEKIKANSFYEATYTPNVYYFGNAEMANRIAEEGKKALQEMCSKNHEK